MRFSVMASQASAANGARSSRQRDQRRERHGAAGHVGVHVEHRAVRLEIHARRCRTGSPCRSARHPDGAALAACRPVAQVRDACAALGVAGGDREEGVGAGAPQCPLVQPAQAEAVLRAPGARSPGDSRAHRGCWAAALSASAPGSCRAPRPRRSACRCAPRRAARRGGCGAHRAAARGSSAAGTHVPALRRAAPRAPAVRSRPRPAAARPTASGCARGALLAACARPVTGARRGWHRRAGSPAPRACGGGSPARWCARCRARAGARASSSRQRAASGRRRKAAGGRRMRHHGEDDVELVGTACGCADDTGSVCRRQQRASARCRRFRTHLLYPPLLAIIAHSNATRHNTRATQLSRPRRRGRKGSRGSRADRMTEPPKLEDLDPVETREWLESIDSVLQDARPGARALSARAADRLHAPQRRLSAVQAQHRVRQQHRRRP